MLNLLFKAVLLWVLGDIIIGAEPKHEVSLVVGCHLHGHLHHGPLSILSYYIPICKHSPRCLVRPWAIIRVAADTALSTHVDIFMLKFTLLVKQTVINIPLRPFHHRSPGCRCSLEGCQTQISTEKPLKEGPGGVHDH